MTICCSGLGQDSHRFDFSATDKPLILGGVLFPNEPPLLGNSDADVVLHALTNAVSGITGVPILGLVSDALCLEQGITDSRVYLAKALEYLGSYQIHHVSLSLECQRPKITPRIPEMQAVISALLGGAVVGITATSGEGLTDFGRGEGIQVLAVVSAHKKDS